MTYSEDKSDRSKGKSLLVFVACLAVLLGAEFTASLVQCDFGRVNVENVRYRNFNGIPIRAKLFRPSGASPLTPLPGVVYIHGYQNNRETGDAYCLELARRGFVVLNIDAIGRGNSGIPNDPEAPDFDPTYGGEASLEYLRSLPYVRKEALGMMGYSLGAEMAYRVALGNPHVQALVITGFAYTEEASPTTPRNMLMIMGKWDEFRQRMTGTRDLEKEWMNTQATRKAFGVDRPALQKTYGDFAEGTARRVFIPRTIHIQESHSGVAIAETLRWMREALGPPARYWKDESKQTWPLKEWATLVAMLACFASLLPLGDLLLGTRAFRSLRGAPTASTPVGTGTFFKFFAINGLLSWLYLPLIFVLFGIHVYLVHIDGLFPLMMVNGIIWWFFWINLIGFFLVKRWYRKKGVPMGLTTADLGTSFSPDRFDLDAGGLARTAFLALILFGFAYLVEHILEWIFIVDFRFIFPFASDLTPYRALVALRYLPFVVTG
ncbi:MAG: dienelactone hydrolase family protein, partial [Deltaproteobacteria bacterium]|nr:dienelactone hydrolase family protein [Deltaproteobacteria bacterium]MBW2009940.1 dienelactone hydrolase family protein [Deltaproteobacteria bacterium]